MKKFFVFVVLSFALVMSTTVSAQQKPNMFPTPDACKDAYQSGNYTPYVAMSTRLHDKNPADGVKRVVIPLEADACIHPLTMAGKQWVVELKGFPMRWETNADGSLKETPYAMDVCGNPNDGILYLSVTTPAPKAAAPATTNPATTPNNSSATATATVTAPVNPGNGCPKLGDLMPPQMVTPSANMMGENTINIKVDCPGMSVAVSNRQMTFADRDFLLKMEKIDKGAEVKIAKANQPRGCSLLMGCAVPVNYGYGGVGYVGGGYRGEEILYGNQGNYGRGTQGNYSGGYVSTGVSYVSTGYQGGYSGGVQGLYR